VDTLEDLLGATEHPTVWLGAARTVVELAVHHQEAVAIVRRLDEIEALHRAATIVGQVEPCVAR
jgi:hypothetical protein